MRIKAQLLVWSLAEDDPSIRRLSKDLHNQSSQANHDACRMELGEVKGCPQQCHDWMEFISKSGALSG